jgi:hypothetical protein
MTIFSTFSWQHITPNSLNPRKGRIDLRSS